MSTTRKIFFYFIIFLATVLVLLSMASLVRGVSWWYSNVLDFPRTQYLIAAVVLLPLFVLLNRKWGWPDWLLAVGLVAAIAVQGSLIFPYLLGSKQVADAAPEEITEENTVGVLIANVLQTNDSSAAFLDIVRRRDPDMLLVMEVNDRWMEDLAPLDGNYPHVVKQPNDVAYGMALYSKFPLADTEIKYFNHDNIPSIHTRVTLPSGGQFVFHGVHPAAPVPSKKYPDNQGEKEVALGEVADMVVASPLPDLVCGDFNDVSWSQTAKFFEDEGNLDNVRLGRGLYNSFSAHSMIMRWPLDHYFVDKAFALITLERLPAFGSDHFPMYAEFMLR